MKIILFEIFFSLLVEYHGLLRDPEVWIPMESLKGLTVPWFKKKKKKHLSNDDNRNLSCKFKI